MEYEDMYESNKNFSNKLEKIIELYKLPSLIKTEDGWLIYVLDNGKAEWVKF